MSKPALKRKFKQFEQAREGFKFDLIEEKFSTRADLHAFILLNKLCPDRGDIIDGAEHDKCYLNIDTSRLATIASDDNIRDLVRCGINYDDISDTLYIYC